MQNSEYKVFLINKAYGFSLKTITMARDLQHPEYYARVLLNQMIRSVTSVGANIIEAQASPTRKDFAHFLSYALKSANESRYWLALLKDSEIGNRKQIENLLLEAQEISRLLGSSLKKLKTR